MSFFFHDKCFFNKHLPKKQKFNISSYFAMDLRTWKAHHQGTTENSRVGHCTYTSENNNAKVQNVCLGEITLLLLHWLYCPCITPASIRINFQASLFLAIFLQHVTPIFFRSFSTSANHLFLGFPTDHFPSGIFLSTFSQFFLLAFFPHVLTIVIFLF